ncbi:MAG: hypothetical protein J0H44_19790 [Alphaproteobacteria bacterium]|nr:hypothetical protein [Alphaproteobacteria bacterium]
MTWKVGRYRAKPEQAGENQRLIEAVFLELHTKRPAGLRYAAFRLPDGAFVHVVSAAQGAAPLNSFEAFRAFADGAQERCLELPQVGEAIVVGSYGMFASDGSHG